MTYPVLYIIMRQDMDSMNPGKCMAQASHASNAFVHKVFKQKDTLPISALESYRDWQASTAQGFGTAVVLGTGTLTEEDAPDGHDKWLHDLVVQIQACPTLGQCTVSDTVVDPTYPIRDGRTTHFLDVVTCAYVFIHKSDVDMMPESFKKLELHS